MTRRAPLSIPHGSVMVDRSLWVFPDPALAHRVLAEGADPQVYGGHCVFYGGRLAPRTRSERFRQRLKHWLARARARTRWRVRSPFRLVGTWVALAYALYGGATRQLAPLMAGLGLMGIVVLHYHLTRREG